MLQCHYYCAPYGFFLPRNATKTIVARGSNLPQVTHIKSFHANVRDLEQAYCALAFLF